MLAKLTLDSSDYDKGLDNAKKGAEGFGEQWDKAKGKMQTGAKDIAVGAGALAGLGAAAFKAADSLSKNLDEIDKTSQKIGWSSKAYQEWDYVLQRNGSSMQSMTMGLKTLTNKFAAAKQGTASAVDAFSKLGLSMEDIQDLSQEDLFGTVITALQGMEEGADRAAIANELLGRAGQELGPTLNSTAEDTAALIQQVNDLGGVMSEDAVAQGAAFQDSLTDVKTAMAGVSASLVGELLPVITTLMNKVSQFVASGGLEKIIQLMKDLAPVIGIVVGAFAGFKIVSGLVSLIQGVTTAFGALNAIMLANPIGLIIAGITALIAAFVLLWNNCEGFRNFWIGVWESIKNFAVDAWEGIKNTFAAIGEWFTEKFQAAKEGMVNAWSNVKEKFSEKWADIKSAFSAVGEWFSERFSEAKENALNAWNNIKEKAAEIWSLFKDGFTISDALNWGKDMIDNFISGITEKWENLKSTIAGIGQTIKDFLGFSEPKEGPLSNFHTFAPDMMKLFAEGIADNEHLVTDQLSKSFDFGDYAISGTVQAGGEYGGGAASGRTIIGFDIDTEGLVRYLRPYIKDEDLRIGGAMVV